MVMETMFAALGTVNQMSVRYAPEEREQVRRAMKSAEAYVNAMDDRLSVFKEESEVSHINQNAGQRDTFVTQDTFALLRLAREYGTKTGGAFDITTLPLTGTRAQPSAGRVNYRDILLSRRRSSVRLRRPGQGIHLGGIAKGYAVDRVAAMLSEGGVKDAVINLGGTVRHIGQSRQTGIRSPFAKGDVAATLVSVDEAVVTSGLYERGSHIFNPLTGQPADTDLLSATVVGQNGAAADAAATACMVLGLERSVKLLSSMKLEGILIAKNGGVFVTQGIRPRVHFFE